MSENIIYPVQPFFVMDSEYYYKRFLPGSPIAHFYGFNSKEHIEIKNGVIPDGSVDIIFNCGKDSPQAVIAGSVESGTRNIFKENTAYFGVRLMPGVLNHFGEAAARDLVGHTMNFSEIMKNSAAVEKICCAETFEEKINGFITSFPEIAQKPSVTNSYGEIVREITGEIYGAEGNIKISELEKRLVYSRRHLLRVFKEFTGMDIKKFCRIVRFQAAMFLRPSVQKTERGFIDWIEMFIKEPFQSMTAELRQKIYKEIEDNARPELYTKDGWVIDYTISESEQGQYKLRFSGELNSVKTGN